VVGIINGMELNNEMHRINKTISKHYASVTICGMYIVSTM